MQEWQLWDSHQLAGCYLAQLWLKSLHPRRLRNTCNPAADVFLAVPWTALVIENCSRLMMLLDTWVEFKFRSIHHAMSWEIPLRFVKVTWTSPVCIPSAILCAKVPCVVPLWSFPCPWRVQLGEVPSPYLTCPMRTATTWSPDGILVPWSGGYRSDAGENDDVSRNPFLWTLKLCYKSVDLWCIQGMQKKHINTNMRI